MPEYVYVLSNPAMSGIVKVGWTGNVSQRIRSLSSHSGVPVPFDLELAIEVTDAKRLEGALHGLLQGSRLNPNREFFEVDVENLKIVLTEYGTDVTAAIDPRQAPSLPLQPDGVLDSEEDELRQIDDDDFAAGARLRRRRPPLDFDELGLTGSLLTCTREGPNGEPESAKVIERKHVRFRKKRRSLTEATRLALGRNYDVPPLPYWHTEDGRLLQDIYDDYHGPRR